MRRTVSGKYFVVYAALAIMLVFSLFPVYWMLNTSFKTQAEIYNMVPSFWPKVFDGSAYSKLIYKLHFLKNVYNSLMVSTIVSVVSVFLSMLTAYAIAKMKFRGRTVISKGILYAYLMPRSVLFIPLYIIAAYLGLTDSIYGLLFVYPTITIPYATWMLVSYFKSIPGEIEESAMIDGCSRIGSMFRILFPLSAPGIAATLIFSFTLCWCEYLYALVLINKTADKTVTLSLSNMVANDVYPWGPLMGGSLIASIPVVIMYLFVSRYMVSGMTMGAVK